MEDTGYRELCEDVQRSCGCALCVAEFKTKDKSYSFKVDAANINFYEYWEEVCRRNSLDPNSLIDIGINMLVIDEYDDIISFFERDYESELVGNIEVEYYLETPDYVPLDDTAVDSDSFTLEDIDLSECGSSIRDWFSSHSISISNLACIDLLDPEEVEEERRAMVEDGSDTLDYDEDGYDLRDE